MIKFLAKLLLASALCCTAAYAGVVVVPNANTGVVGNDTSGALPASPVSIEVQDVYNATQFPTGPLNITGFAWRAVPGTGALSVTISGNIFVSTSPKVANNPPGPLLSLTFANNVGPDNLLVLTASNATMSGAGCAVVGTTPCPFAGSIAFTTPFPYNPANGSLLLDLKATSFSGSGQFDVIDCSAPACVSSAVHGSPLGSATGTPNGGGGNIVQFTFTAGVSATPVPPSILLTLIGLACVGFYVGRRGTKFA